MRILRALSLAVPWLCCVANASTNAVDPEQLAYNLRTTVDAYEKYGKKNSKWDVDAKACLAAFARLRATTNSNVRDDLADLRAKLPKVMEMKCDDPMVRYLYARFVYLDAHSADENSKEFQEVDSALANSGYPDIRKYYATMWSRRMIQPATPGRPELTNLLQRAAVSLAKALRDESMPQLEADEGCDLLMSVPWWADGTRWDYYQILEPALTNRWKNTSVALLAKGQGYLSYGWRARGLSYADKVPEQGWQSLAERLDIAADALETAWKQNPNDGRICLEMMRVELGQGKGRARMELWFRRGMQLNPSYRDLCIQKIEYLRPRWHGSLKAMIDFGRECTLNTNWTGSVRLMLADAHEEAVREIQDSNERRAYWSRPNVWPDIQLTYEQFFKLYPERDGYRHNYARYAARCGQWQVFLNQAKLFPSTNYAYFGGEQAFNGLLQTAMAQTKKN